jgi:type II secretory pathway pseudopilin PulG
MRSAKKQPAAEPLPLRSSYAVQPILRRGLSAAEVIVVIVVVALFILMIVASLPRQREAARNVACQSNLMQIGMALAIYDQSFGHLPTVPELGAAPSISPLGAILGELGLADFTRLNPSTPPPGGGTRAEVVERSVAGFTCPSDPLATSAVFAAPISYRANTGDRPNGETGPFAPGHVVRIADVQAADGLSHTSAFSERLVGNTQPVPDHRNYALVPGPVSDAGCPRVPETAWRGDAGASWLPADWRYTVYNHVLTPNAAPSCVAADGRSAAMGASSGHINRVHVLLLDGSVRPFTNTVDAKIWRSLANFKDGEGFTGQPKSSAGP